jgi:hypothetical protein
MLREIASDLWVGEQPFRYLAMEAGVRMSVIRLRDRSLMLHSPIPLDQQLRGELDGLGTVRFVVAPNRFHHLFLADYMRVYSRAEFYCAPGLEKKRADLKFTSVLTDAAPAGWAGEIDQLVFTAFSPLKEVMFFHRASRTLLLSDLLFNVSPGHGSWRSRLVLWLDGCDGRAAVPRSFRPFLKLRRRAAKRLIERVLDWDLDRIVMAHGEIVERDGKQALAQAWSFL